MEMGTIYSSMNNENWKIVQQVINLYLIFLKIKKTHLVVGTVKGVITKYLRIYVEYLIQTEDSVMFGYSFFFFQVYF